MMKLKLQQSPIFPSRIKKISTLPLIPGPQLRALSAILVLELAKLYKKSIISYFFNLNQFLIPQAYLIDSIQKNSLKITFIIFLLVLCYLKFSGRRVCVWGGNRYKHLFRVVYRSADWLQGK